MPLETAIAVALIGLAGVLLAALAGVGGVIVGSRIAAQATKAAAAAALESARADRHESRRARFADTIRDLSIEALEVADDDVDGILAQWDLRDRANPAQLPARTGGRALRVLRRLRMLVAEPTMQAAVDELEAAILSIENLAIRTDQGHGMKIYGPAATEEERAHRDPATDRYYAAVEAFEAAVRMELGASSPVD